MGGEVYAGRLLIAAVLSLGAHYVFASAVERLPRRDPPPRPRPLSVRLVDVPPPPPEQPPAPPTEAPAPVPEVPLVVPDPVAPPPEPARPRPKPRPKAPPKTRAADATPSDKAVTTEAPKGPTTEVPVFGVTMESNSTRGPVVPRGNTTDGAARPAEGPVRPLAGGGAPVAAHEVSKMPLPIGRCEGQSTPEAQAAGTEGVVVLDLVVGEDGRARDIEVVRGLPHGLNEAAVAALKGCRFRPGERSGQAVPVRIRAFKVRFVLDDDR